jgi:uncharacterized protein YndB with AHSA1/START domain
MNTISTTRHIPATPRDLFAAFAQPERLARWWGPDGFRNQFDVFEFTPGGRWIFDMIGPGGERYPNESAFVEIRENELIVLDHVNKPHFRLTIALAPDGDGTLVRWTGVFKEPEVLAALLDVVKPSNEQNLDRWTAEVARGTGHAG